MFDLANNKHLAQQFLQSLAGPQDIAHPGAEQLIPTIPGGPVSQPVPTQVAPGAQVDPNAQPAPTDAAPLPSAQPARDPNDPRAVQGIAQQMLRQGHTEQPGHIAPTAANQSDLIQANRVDNKDMATMAAAGMQNADDAEAQAEGIKALALQDSKDKSEDDAIDRQKYYTLHAQETQRRAEDILQKQAEAVDEMRKITANKPTGIWGKSGVNPIAGSIALALSSFGPGATNSAMDAINHRIESNIADQKRQFEQLGTVASKYGNVYADLHTKLGDDGLVMNTMRQLSLEATGAMADAALNRNASPLIAAAHQKIKAMIDMDLAKTQTAIGNTAVDQGSKAAEVRINAQKNYTDMFKAKTEQQKVDNDNVNKKLEFAKDIEVANINHKNTPHSEIAELSGTADLPEDAKMAVSKVYAAGKKINSTIDRMIANKSQGALTRILYDSEARGELLSQIRAAEGLSSRVSGQEGNLLKQIAGFDTQNPMSEFLRTFDEDKFRADLEHFREATNEGIRDSIPWKGVEPLPGSYLYREKDAQGNVAPTRAQTLQNIPAE